MKGEEQVFCPWYQCFGFLGLFVILQVYGMFSFPNGGYPYEVDEDIDCYIPGVRPFPIPDLEPVPLDRQRRSILWFDQGADFFSFLKVTFHIPYSSFS